MVTPLIFPPLETSIKFTFLVFKIFASSTLSEISQPFFAYSVPEILTNKAWFSVISELTAFTISIRNLALFSAFPPYSSVLVLESGDKNW
ncbi:hypothetical protein D3C86_1392300 [compost metagenome]